jgi:hypothetical protein
MTRGRTSRPPFVFASICWLVGHVVGVIQVTVHTRKQTDLSTAVVCLCMSALGSYETRSCGVKVPYRSLLTSFLPQAEGWVEMAVKPHFNA